MNKNPLISLCIPTNGVIEWVFPVLDSIYSQNVDLQLFEVVITDNGNNETFKHMLNEYLNKYINLHYFKSSGYEFLSEPDSYKNANGDFIKFVNHRTKLVPGALKYWIDWVEANKEEKPIVYFSNGKLHYKEPYICSCFNDFVKGLSYWSSWSTGMAFWKEDFNELNNRETTVYNTLFPHITILFDQKNREKYIIDDKFLLDELPQGNIPKGRYNLFNAFSVEYMGIISDLLRGNFISLDTYLYIKKENKKFLCNLFNLYIIRKLKCSYDLSEYKKSLNVFYSFSEIKKSAFWLFIKRIVRFPLKLFFR